MKELQPQVRIEQSEVEDQKKEVHRHTMKLKKGLKLWEYHIDTGDLAEVSIERLISMQEKTGKLAPIRKDKASWKKRCMYFQALNEKNAAKKVKRMLSDIGISYKVIDD